MSNAHVSYKPHSDTTPEIAREVLVAVYGFVLDCHAKKEGAEQSARNDAKETDNARARSILPR